MTDINVSSFCNIYIVDNLLAYSCRVTSFMSLGYEWDGGKQDKEACSKRKMIFCNENCHFGLLVWVWCNVWKTGDNCKIYVFPKWFSKDTNIFAQITFSIDSDIRYLGNNLGMLVNICVLMCCFSVWYVIGGGDFTVMLHKMWRFWLIFVITNHLWRRYVN